VIGTRLSHYEITAHLGTGGMGEVYQASDSKLGRNVAIKILPDEFARDSERAARFEREARVLASLNHPHIAAIHGIEEFAGRKFLVMELAAGETLAARIGRGPLPLDDALTIATQIAEALEAAHEKGVVHRDLKPANIKVTPDGQVKVLDFGLAKAFSEEAENLNLSNSPTLSRLATNAGMILGTAAYMSPEQAKGLEVDRRTDIFAFGCVLYEMLTGRQAFQGDTVSDILADVLRAEPDMNRLPSDTPQRFRQLLAKCLQKDRVWRLQSAGDARIEIRDIRNNPAVPILPVAAPARRGRERLFWIAALLVLAGVAVTLSVPYFRVPAASDELRAEIMTPPTTDPMSFAISPDGSKLVFIASGNSISRLWLRSMDSTGAQPLAGTDGASYPFWSPDNRSVAFFADGKLKRTEIRGGTPQTIANAPVGRGGAWAPDGTILFSLSSTGTLYRVPSTGGGEAVPATKLDARSSGHRFPSFLPDGRQFLFFAQGSEAAGIYIGSLDSSETKRLTTADTAGIYVGNGWLLYPNQATLLARRLDLTKRELTGDPVNVADSVMVDTNFNVAAMSVSSTGFILYRVGIASRRQVAWFDRTGKLLEAVGSPDEFGIMATALSPDGKRVAAQRAVQNNTDIWLFDSARTTRFTFDTGLDRFAQWSGDGTRIVFDSNRTGRRNLYVKPADNSRTEELLLDTPDDKASNDWSSDNKFILYNTPANVGPTGSDVWVFPLEGDRKPYPFVQTNYEERLSQFSPDVHWIAYQSNESGRYEIYIRPFPGSGAQSQISTNGGIQVRWRHDGKELYYVAPDGKLTAVSIDVKGTALNPGSPVTLFQTRLWGGGTNTNNGFQYDVDPDGRFLMNTATEESVTAPITLLLNWKPPAK
jgi:serine/threonine protein kinase